MTLATTALALYHRTKAQYLHLTHPAPLLPPDHNHPQHPLTIAFPTHRTTTTHRHRPRPRPLTKAIRHVLAAYPPAPLPPPSPTPPTPTKPPCRLCAATTQPPPTHPPPPP